MSEHILVRDALLASPEPSHMQHRDIEYTVVQGLGRQLWKWSVFLKPDHLVRGQATSKKEAIAEAERAIDRALAPKKIRLPPPG